MMTMSSEQMGCGASSGASQFVNNISYSTNPHFQEVCAALRRGIETGKGLILFTGEAGRGKTTLLCKVIRELEDKVSFVVESEPGASFSSLLRLLARNLHGEIIDPADRLSLLLTCKQALRSEIERGRMLCLVIDNAESLRDDTLECVLKNFLGTDIAADRPLLSVVLAGRPELRHKLLQPRRGSPAPVPDLVCQLESLNAQESAAYIRRRLQAGHLPSSALQHDAVERIAGYAGGDFRLTNSLCSNVLALAARSPAPVITVETVDAAARELALEAPRSGVRRQTGINFQVSRERDEPFGPHWSETDTTEVIRQTFLDDRDDVRLGRARRRRRVLRIFLGATFLAAAFFGLRHHFGAFFSLGWTELSRALSNALQPSSPAPSGDSAAIGSSQDPPPAPANDETPILDEELTAPGRGETDHALALWSAALRDEAADETPMKRKGATTAQASSPSDREGRVSEKNLSASDQQLEMKVYKALADRAILGVTVSVSQRTVHLEGRVATERQKRAAERAAQGVKGIEEVRSRISIG